MAETVIYMTELMNTIVGLFFQLYNTGQTIFILFFHPISEFIEELFPDLFGKILGTTVGLFFADLSLAQIMLGVGLTVYIAYQFTTWVLNIVT